MEVRAPRRVTRAHAFRVGGDADRVFPLFCPVRELHWLESWSPGVVFSTSGVAEPECVFTSSDENGETIWLVTRHDPESRRLEMVRTTPGFTVCLLAISVRPLGPAECEVSVSYSHTALSEAGAAFIEEFSEDAYARMMAHWQAALDHYLAHGSPMPGT